MRIEPEISSVQIVVLGKINPAIFSPAWFVHMGLLHDDAKQDAVVAVVHPQVTEFQFDWVRVKATPERFEVETLQAPYARLMNFAASVFESHLPHTPLTAFGINRAVHFRVRSRADRDRLGTTLVPLEPWGPWREDLQLDRASGGMTAVRMSQHSPPGRHANGQINIVVEPSQRVGREHGTGVFASVNDHFAADGDDLEAGQRLIRVMRDEFDASVRRSAGIIDHIMSLVEGERTR